MQGLTITSKKNMILNPAFYSDIDDKLGDVRTMVLLWY